MTPGDYRNLLYQLETHHWRCPIPKHATPIATPQLAAKHIFNPYEGLHVKSISSRWRRQTGARKSLR
eukprot:1659490-Karenia_brevis.AAC.1